MISVIPAIIPKSFEDLTDKMSLVKGTVSIVQVDVMDGTYALEKTWPYFTKQDADFERIKKEENGFPFWEDMGFEVDMMVANPENKIDEWISAGAESLIIHIESTNQLEKIIEKGKNKGVKIGLALKPSTGSEKLFPYVDPSTSLRASFVQFMGSDNIGHHGEDLDPRVIEKIRDFRLKFKEIPIAIDIGVNFDTAPDLVSAGATRLVSGSAIFESGNIREAISQLKNLDTELNS